MPAVFRLFENKEEENKASALIETIDKGEKWIFEGSQGSEDFGGFINRLYYSDNGIFGTYNACIYGGKLRIQIAFSSDLPKKLSISLLSLIKSARRKCNTFTSIWYKPENMNLDKFLFNELPWKAKGHKTHELTALRGDFSDVWCILPQNFSIKPFEGKYLVSMCNMLDKSLAHTFEDPDKGIFMINNESFLKDWIEKAKSAQCCIMLENDFVIGAYILKGAEIDFIAVAVDRQGKGLGKQLLRHAINNILNTSDDNPYLYCIDRNSCALQFYLHEGMVVTGHSGYIYLPEEKN